MLAYLNMQNIILITCRNSDVTSVQLYKSVKGNEKRWKRNFLSKANPRQLSAIETITRQFPVSLPLAMILENTKEDIVYVIKRRILQAITAGSGEEY